MGHFVYSALRGSYNKKPDLVEKVLVQVVKELWSDAWVERVEGVPIDKGDNRKAKWAVCLPGWSDAAFALSLLRDGRLEFKWPPGEDRIKMQRQARMLLVRRLNVLAKDEHRNAK
jgi:hypothetical protein